MLIKITLTIIFLAVMIGVGLYTRKDNEAMSQGLIDALIRQGFLPHAIKMGKV